MRATLLFSFWSGLAEDTLGVLCLVALVAIQESACVVSRDTLYARAGIFLVAVEVGIGDFVMKVKRLSAAVSFV